MTLEVVTNICSHVNTFNVCTVHLMYKKSLGQVYELPNDSIPLGSLFSACDSILQPFLFH